MELETMDVLTEALATPARRRLRLRGSEHPVSTELLNRFAAGSTARDENLLVVRHLLSGCPSCGRRLGRSWLTKAPQESERAYDQALDRTFERTLQALRLRCAAA